MSRAIPYGQGPGQIGVIRESGKSTIGPESFALTPKSSMVVGDLVNQRLLEFSYSGELMRTIPLPNVVISDLTFDSRGRSYVFDQVQGTVTQYEGNGAFLSRLSARSLIGTRGYFHVVDDYLLFADAACRDVLIADLAQEQFRPIGDNEVPKIDGITMESGAVFQCPLS